MMHAQTHIMTAALSTEKARLRCMISVGVGGVSVCRISGLVFLFGRLLFFHQWGELLVGFVHGFLFFFLRRSRGSVITFRCFIVIVY